MTTCSRCQWNDPRNFATLADLPDEDYARSWEGSAHEPVCPGCRLRTWHPHCLSFIDGEGLRVEVGAMSAGLRSSERAEGGMRYCEHVDLSVGYEFGAANWPHSWRCSECGGTEFEFVREDHRHAGRSSGVAPGGAKGPTRHSGGPGSGRPRPAPAPLRGASATR